MTQPTAIGIDFGGTTVKIGLVRAGELIRQCESLPTLAYPNGEALLAAIFLALEELRAFEPEVAAIGVGLPGIVDSRHGIVHHLTNVPGWENVPLRALITARMGLPTIIENDANAMTYAEWKFGAGRGRQNVVCVTLGTGVGGGLIFDGRLYRGSTLGAGEIGNMTIDYRGVPGPYGNFGAIERYVGNHQIAQRAALRYAAAGEPREPAACTPLALAEAALAGDEIAGQLWEETGVMLGALLADIVWLLNPGAIVLGGGVANAGELVLAPIRRTIRERTLFIFHERLDILPAQLGHHAGLIGCGALALDALPSGPVDRVVPNAMGAIAGPRSKIISAAELTNERDRLQAAGKRLVLTNGCFDLLHVGHVRYLQAARALGDALAVAVNADDSVRALKGPGRPLNPADERAEVLAALDCVDYVTIFEEARATRLLDAVRPHVYAKGGDYRLETLDVAERAVLEGAGAEIRLLPMTPGRSTSRLIDAVRGEQAS